MVGVTRVVEEIRVIGVVGVVGLVGAVGLVSKNLAGWYEKLMIAGID